LTVPLTTFSTSTSIYLSPTKVTVASTTAYQCILDIASLSDILKNQLPLDSRIGTLFIDNTSVLANGTLLYLDDTISIGSIVQIDECYGFICNSSGLQLTSFDCQENCTVSEWTEWSLCTADCQTPGIQQRYRKLYNPNAHCSQILEEVKTCINVSLSCNTCEVSNWSGWSNCTKECGGGISTRKRQLHACPNQNCQNILEETDFCNTQCCKIDGKWSAWTSWSNCSSNTCETGSRIRTRACSRPDCGGSECEGSPIQTEPCNNCEDPLLFEKCTSNKIWALCSNNCSLSCSTLECKNCKAPDTCIPGCTCPPGLVTNSVGECISPEQCPCSFNNVDLAPNQLYTTECQTQ